MTTIRSIFLHDFLAEIARQAAACYVLSRQSEDYLNAYLDEYNGWKEAGLLANLTGLTDVDISPERFEEYLGALFNQAQLLQTEPGRNFEDNPWRHFAIEAMEAHRLQFHIHPAHSRQTEGALALADYQRALRTFPGAVILSAPTKHEQGLMHDLVVRGEWRDDSAVSKIACVLQNGLPQISLENTCNALTDGRGKYLMPQTTKGIGRIGGIAGQYLAKVANAEESFSPDSNKFHRIAQRVGFHWNIVASSVIKQALALTVGGIVDPTITPRLPTAVPGGAAWHEVRELNAKQGLALVVGHSFMGEPANATSFVSDAYESTQLFQPLLWAQISWVVVVNLDNLKNPTNPPNTYPMILARKIPGNDSLLSSELGYLTAVENNRALLVAIKTNKINQLLALICDSKLDETELVIEELKPLNNAVQDYPSVDFCVW